MKIITQVSMTQISVHGRDVIEPKHCKSVIIESLLQSRNIMKF